MMIRSFKILLLLLLIPEIIYAQASKDNYSSSSVLSSGQWFKIAILQDGIYRIDYSRLKQLGLLNPSNPLIFGNNFGQLSYYNNDPEPDDLKELSILTVTGSDGIFNEGDYILFYGQGTGRWKYNSESDDYDYTPHNYSDTAFYYLTSGSTPGRQIKNYSEPGGSPNFLSAESDALFYYEKEIENLIKSGREWYQPLSAIQGITINPAFTDILTNEPLKFDIRVASRAPVNTQFRLLEGTSIHESLQVQAVNMQNSTGIFAQIVDSSGSSFPLSSTPVFEIKYYTNGEPGARGWLDYIKLQAREKNSYSGNTAFFSDKKSIGSGNITGFTFQTSLSPAVWDITDPINPMRIVYSRSGNNITFKASTDTLRYYVFFSESNAVQPFIKSKPVPNQDLHGSAPADMIIVTHPLFLKYSEFLAELHYKESGLISMIVTPEEIYNEFSGGVADIAAIRNFIRMKFIKQNGSQRPLKYLLLFGDGSYENRTLPPKNPNFIPTYQSQISNIVVSSFTSDDFYGLLEDGEGEADGTEDIGIGRIPVSDTTQAGIVVRKIKKYISPSNTGAWKNVICLSADDEDGNAHMSDAEGLASFIKDSIPVLNINKIYLDAFRQITTANGQTYPDVTTAINNQINSGCIIFNYTGHGSENGLAAERVVKTEDINSWKNGSKLPLFITATCEFSRFDDIDLNIITHEIKERTSAGEMVLLKDQGGGIALMSTTRLVYSAPNYYLNKNIYDYAFDRDTDGNALRLGDIIKLAKIKSGNGPNKRNFLLLGDPAVRLEYPWHGDIITDSINHKYVKNNPDTLKALSQVTISGHIETSEGQIMNNFNGVVSPIVFDKTSSIRTLANDGGQTMQFDLRNNILFSGNTTASGGKFSFTFIVPRDIDYSFGTGKISYYANDSQQDMNGSYSDVIVGGFTSSTLPDTSGPHIRLFMNDTLFRNGGITDNNPRMLAIIEDTGGINTTGSGIGHDLTAFIDNDRNRSFVLNNYFENDFDNYKRGKIEYSLLDLSEGSHSLTLKAWDNFNNSSEKTIDFVVETDGKFILKNLINYPNPIFNETSITAEHNRPDEEFEITISIFDITGRIIKNIKTSEYSSGYQLFPIVWDRTGEGGERVGQGIYPYRLQVKTGSGEISEISGRMIIL
jgi:hypothetical protein